MVGQKKKVLRFYCAKGDEFTVEDGCLLRGTRVVITSRYQQEVLSELSGGQIWTVTSRGLQEIDQTAKLTVVDHL